MTDETGWRPIETAEKLPGRLILLCDDLDRWPYVGCWVPDMGDDGLWMESDGCTPDFQPTHWMPLPPPPTPKEPA